jgi:hypothetical protein
MDIQKFAKDHKLDSKLVATVLASLENERFGPVEIRMSDADRAYPDRFRPGDVSTKLADVIVPFPMTGAAVTSTVYARLTKKDDGHEISYSASVPKGLRFDDPNGKESFLAHVELAVQSWPGFAAATMAADARLLAGPDGRVKRTGKDGKPVADMRPRLVKAVKVTAEPVGAPQPTA